MNHQLNLEIIQPIVKYESTKLFALYNCADLFCAQCGFWNVSLIFRGKIMSTERNTHYHRSVWCSAAPVVVPHPHFERTTGTRLTLDWFIFRVDLCRKVKASFYSYNGIASAINNNDDKWTERIRGSKCIGQVVFLERMESILLRWSLETTGYSSRTSKAPLETKRRSFLPSIDRF